MTRPLEARCVLLRARMGPGAGPPLLPATQPASSEELLQFLATLGMEEDNCAKVGTFLKKKDRSALGPYGA